MPRDNLCFFDRIEILALQILLRTNREQLRIIDLADDCWKLAALASLVTDSSPGDPSPMAIDELDNTAPSLVWVAVWPHDQHTLEPCFAHTLREILHARIAE
jgi:hypothetical protein